MSKKAEMSQLAKKRILKEWKCLQDSPPDDLTAAIHHMKAAFSGVICLDILKNKWVPGLDISKVLLSIVQLMNEPNPSDPLVSAIAKTYNTDRAVHDREARDWMKRYAV